MALILLIFMTVLNCMHFHAVIIFVSVLKSSRRPSVRVLDLRTKDGVHVFDSEALRSCDVSHQSVCGSSMTSRTLGLRTTGLAGAASA